MRGAGNLGMVGAAAGVSRRWRACVSEALAVPLAFPTDSAEPPQAGRLRAAQLRELSRAAPGMMAANLLNAGIAVAAALGHTPGAAILAWFLIATVVPGMTLVKTLRRRKRPPRESVPAHAVQRAILNASMLAAIWCVVPLAVFDASEQTRLLIGLLMAGLMGVGAYALAPVPLAALAYCVIVGAGNTASLILSDAGFRFVIVLLLGIYFVTIVRGVIVVFRGFRERVEAEEASREQRDTIALLLSEFEAGASDWLFMLDDRLRLATPSDRLREVSGFERADLRDRPFQDLLAPREVGRFLALIEAGRPFRGLIVQAEAADGSTRWWKLTANPVFRRGGEVAGWRGVGSDVTAETEAQDRLAWLARTDSLTGLANRLRFAEAAEEAARRSGAAGGVAIACMDLDRFKIVNDTFGHPVGDRLLVEVARRLREAGREGLLIARLGGDEFGLLFSDLESESEALRTLEEIRAAVMRVYEIDGFRFSVGAAIGLACSATRDVDAERLVRAADLALYKAKSRGTGTIVAFDDEMKAEAEAARRIREALEGAVDQDELELRYQPIVEAATGRVTGLEALVRWRHPSLGLVSPASFVPIAEASGLIIPIGRWVIARALQDLAEWDTDATLAVNLSPAQFGDPLLVDWIAAELRRSRIPARRLEMEITEDVLAQALPATARTLQEIQELGVGLAIDDFGKGYSSLEYLTRIPARKLKIDRSFVCGIESDRRREAIVSAILGLARRLELATVCEGVETAAELDRLQRLGGVCMQGFLFSPPLRADEVPGFLRRADRGRSAVSASA